MYLEWESSSTSMAWLYALDALEYVTLLDPLPSPADFWGPV